MSTTRAFVAGLLLTCNLLAAAPRKPAPAPPWLRGMTLRQKIAQLVVPVVFGDNPSSRSADNKKYLRWVKDIGVGGLIVANRVNSNGLVVNAQPYEMVTFINRMQKAARVPLLMSADFERGASMRVAGTVRFPYPMAYNAAGDLEAARALGAATAREARAMGIHWVFAPVADVNNNPDNPIINIRSFGEDPEVVAKFVAAFTEGAHSDPANYVLTTAKHFPGHGDVTADSHLEMPKLEAAADRIRGLELKPFESAIAAGVDTVMTAHMAVPALEPEEIPATVSSRILGGVLRDELKFRGLIVTDAMDMAGLTKMFTRGEAAVRAIEAGADMLLMPPDPEAAIEALVAAVRSGRISPKRIDVSVRRVLAAKQKVGLARKKLVDPEAIADALDHAEASLSALAVAEKAVTLLKDERQSLPLQPGGKNCLIVMNGSRLSTAGDRLIREFRRRAPETRVRWLDPSAVPAELDRIVAESADCGQVIAAGFIAVAANRGNVALPGDFPRFLAELVKGPAPVVLLSLGNPYLLRSFPDVAAYLTTYSTVEASETAAVRALFGEIPIRGKLPVSIPPMAKVGDGMERPAVASGRGN